MRSSINLMLSSKNTIQKWSRKILIYIILIPIELLENSYVKLELKKKFSKYGKFLNEYRIFNA